MRPMLLSELEWAPCDCTGACKALRATIPGTTLRYLFREPDGSYHLGSESYPIDALDAQCLLFKLCMEHADADAAE